MGRLTLVLLLAVVGLAAGVYVAFRHVPDILGETGCTAGTGRAAVALDPQQAQIAATIAGVAHHRGHAAPRGHRGLRDRHAGVPPARPRLRGPGLGRRVPAAALGGLGAGQQAHRPRLRQHQVLPGPGPVPGYQQMPVYKAAQAVQHSADGYAYVQYQTLAAQLTTAFTGAAPRAVWCWPPGPPGQGAAHPGPPGARQDVRAAARRTGPHRAATRRRCWCRPRRPPGLVGRRLAGDPRRPVPAPRRALRRVPVARADGPYRAGRRTRVLPPGRSSLADSLRSRPGPLGDSCRPSVTVRARQPAGTAILGAT